MPFPAPWAYLSHLELSRWHISRGGVPARLRLHFHGKTVFRRGETDLTHSPYTIPGCTYAPISITPGAGLPYETLFPLSACPAGDPRAGAVRSSLSHTQYSRFLPGRQGAEKAPSASAEFGSFPCAYCSHSPLWVSHHAGKAGSFGERVGVMSFIKRVVLFLSALKGWIKSISAHFPK